MAIGVATVAIAFVACTSGRADGGASSAPSDVAPSTIEPVTSGTIVFDREIPGTEKSRLSIIAPDGTNQKQIGPRSCCARLSPDGTVILVGAPGTHQALRLAVVGVNGSCYRVLPTADPTLNHEPGAWSPDGNRIAFHGWRGPEDADDGIYTERAGDGTDLVRVTVAPPGHADIPIAYSPDGSRLAFFRAPTTGSDLVGDLFVVRTDGTEPVQLNPARARIWPIFGFPEASWSPDGGRVAFNAGTGHPGGGLRAVFVVDADGSHLQRITPWAAWQFGPSWSPDGRWITFNNADAGNQDLFVVHPDGTSLRQLTSASKDGYFSELAVWSPDATTLLFRRGALGDSETQLDLWLVHADGTGLVQLTRKPGVYESYAWGRLAS